MYIYSPVKLPGITKGFLFVKIRFGHVWHDSISPKVTTTKGHIWYFSDPLAASIGGALTSCKVSFEVMKSALKHWKVSIEYPLPHIILHYKATNIPRNVFHLKYKHLRFRVIDPPHKNWNMDFIWRNKATHGNCADSVQTLFCKKNIHPCSWCISKHSKQVGE